jgi:hypothetical protein
MTSSEDPDAEHERIVAWMNEHGWAYLGYTEGGIELFIAKPGTPAPERRAQGETDA